MATPLRRQANRTTEINPIKTIRIDCKGDIDIEHVKDVLSAYFWLHTTRGGRILLWEEPLPQGEEE